MTPTVLTNGDQPESNRLLFYSGLRVFELVALNLGEAAVHPWAKATRQAAVCGKPVVTAPVVIPRTLLVIT